ncbi:MAG: hypothetical protein AB4041_15890 [Microcystaceae cyanobacterium]
MYSLYPSNFSRQKFLRSLSWHLLLFIVGFAAFSSFLRVLLPPLEVPVISSKLRAFEAQKDEIDVIFFGSSRIHRQVDINTFEESLQKKGRSLRAFNFGIAGATQAESYFYLKKILAMKPAELDYVYVELYPLEWGVAHANQRSRRAIAWHDFPHTFWIYRRILGSDQSPRRKYQLIRDNTVPFLYFMTNAGRGYDALGIETATETSHDLEVPLNGNGYISLDDEVHESYEHREADFRIQKAGAFDKQMEAWRQNKLLEAQQPAKPSNTNPPISKISVIQDLNRTIEKAGGKPIYFITSVSYSGEKLISLHDQGYVSDLLTLNDPIKYFDLYQADVRFDAGHLNAKGAGKLSRYLAEQSLPFLEVD